MQTDVHRLRSTSPDKTPNRHPSQTTSRPRSEHEMPTRAVIRPALSYSSRLGIGGGSFATTKDEVLVATGRRGVCAMTTRMTTNATMTLTADDVAFQSSIRTWRTER